MTTVTLIGSPLMGPAVWSSTAAVLAGRGWDVEVVPRPERAPADPGQVLGHLLGLMRPDEDLAVVAHSNAGLYVPALAARRRVVASVFADAALPPASGSAPTAPVVMRDMLRRLADGRGVLPPWTRWWPEEEVASLFPDPQTRAAVEAEQHRLPLSYFTAELAVPDGWTSGPAAYLAFSPAYHAERDQAAAWGWPVQTLPGGHLYPLTDPASVAAAIDELLRRQVRQRSAR